MQIGKAIKIARVRKGWKQSELAKRLGVSATYVSLLECDNRDPSWSFVNRLSDKLEVPLPLLMLLGQDDAETAKDGATVLTVIANELLGLVTGLRVQNVERRSKK